MLTIMFSDMASGILAGVAEYHGNSSKMLYLHMKNHAARIWEQLAKTYVFSDQCDVIADVYDADGRTPRSLTYGGQRLGNVWHMSCYSTFWPSSDAHHWCEAAAAGAQRARSAYADTDSYQSLLKEDKKWHVIL